MTAWPAFEAAWQRPPADGRMRVQPGDADYARQAAAEIAFWAKPNLFSIDAREDAAVNPFSRETNRRFTGDPNVKWHQTLQTYGRFERGLSLGAGGRGQMGEVLELNPSLHLTLSDLSGETLVARKAMYNARFPGRIDAREEDMNFIELPPSAYDVIISPSTLHHVINIEHVADQAARALKPGGYLFVQDYAAEHRCDWRPEKRRLFESLISRDSIRRTGHRAPVTWKDLSPGTVSPFEAVRSEDTLSVLSSRLTPVFVRGVGALAMLFLLSEPRMPAQRIGRRWIRSRVDAAVQRVRARWDADVRTVLPQRLLREVFILDAVLCDAGLLLPGNVFAAFRKNDA